MTETKKMRLQSLNFFVIMQKKNWPKNFQKTAKKNLIL